MKIDKGSESGITWKSKFLFESKLFPLHGAFLLNVKWFGYKIGIQFNNNPLVAEQKSHEIKTVNAYVVFDLGQWPRNQCCIKCAQQCCIKNLIVWCK